MRTLTQSETRTIRIASVMIGIYLVLFLGWRVGKQLETRRTEYQRLAQDAQKLKQELQPYENKTLRMAKLKETFRIDLSKLSKVSVVAEASAAIQSAAKSGGIQLGPIRESSARPSAKELTSMQLEGVGPVPAVMALLHRLEVLGFPLVIESVQFTPESTKPGMVKVNLTIVILDFEQWKSPVPAPLSSTQFEVPERVHEPITGKAELPRHLIERASGAATRSHPIQGLRAPALWSAGKSGAIHRFGMGRFERFDPTRTRWVHIQSGDYADFVAAIQNLTVLPTIHGEYPVDDRRRGEHGCLSYFCFLPGSQAVMASKHQLEEANHV
jgi:hypothetical protein